MIRDLSKMYPPARHPVPHQPGQPFKFTVTESCDRIKEEFQFLQAQYHSLKLECEKLASEKTEMQRHYVMYYEMSYGLNIEMHKQRFFDNSGKNHNPHNPMQLHDIIR
uniref:Groucho/TLE N-terminal Q-rich domain-containing protein n=1 Tax=Sphaeramia orbicularis TaxID=375764 RepID=A0A672ZFY4_9TELE